MPHPLCIPPCFCRSNGRQKKRRTPSGSGAFQTPSLNKAGSPAPRTYLWKKNFMHQQNTGTSRMTT